MLKFVVSFFLLLAFVPVGPAVATDVRLYTERYGHYNFVDKNGEVAGRAADLMRQIMAEASLSADIKIVPWNRGYTLATQKDDVLIYAVLRKPDREQLFHWLVPVLSTELFLYGRADEVRAIDTAMLKTGQVSAACTIGDVTCSMLRGFGVPDEMLLEITDTDRKAVTRVVAAGRADVFIMQDMSRIRRAAAQPYPFKILSKLEQKQVFYLAAGKQVKPATVAAVRAAYARLKATGKLIKVSGAP